MKILYLNPDPPSVYRYYSDLEKSLKKIICINSGNPDVIVFGLTWLGRERGMHYWRSHVPTVCFVHKIGLDWERKERFLKQCDLVLSSVPRLPVKHRLFKHAADPEVFKPCNEKIFDFGFSGALHDVSLYPKGTFSKPNLRVEAQKLARKQTDLSLFLNGSDNIQRRIHCYEKYAEILSQSKIWLATTGPNGDIGPRYYEVWASKTLLFCDKVPDEYRDTFRDGVNCIEFADDLSDFIPKLRYYLKNEGERKTIVNNAYDDFLAGHTWAKRAEELCSIIKDTIHTKTMLKNK